MEILFTELEVFSNSSLLKEEVLLITAIPSLLTLFIWSNLPEIRILLFGNKLIFLIKLSFHEGSDQPVGTGVNVLLANVVSIVPSEFNRFKNSISLLGSRRGRRSSRRRLIQGWSIPR